MNMVPVAQWLERVTVDDEVEGSTPFRHPKLHKPHCGLFVINLLNLSSNFEDII